MVTKEAKFPGIEINGSIDLSCQHNQQLFQKSLKILRLILEFGDKRKTFWLGSLEPFLWALPMDIQGNIGS